MTEKNDRRARYEWDAHAYERHSEGQLKWAIELMSKIHWAGSEAVIDLGCGDGKVSAHLAERVPRGRVLGIDSASAMIDLARQKFPSERHPNLQFACMDFRDLGFDEEFDLAFSNAALHWVKEQRSVLLRVAQALRPEGRILFQMGGTGNAHQVLAIIEKLIAQKRWRPWFENFEFPYGFYNPRDYDGWAAEAGLTILRNELIPKDMVHHGINGLAGWIRTTWLPYLDRLPLGEREIFTQTLCGEYFRHHPPDDAGRVHVSMVRLEVEAVRAN